MILNERYDYIDLTSETQKNGKRHYVSPDGQRLSSVTTILNATKDTTFLKAWRDRIGDAAADRQVKEAINVGNLLHSELEKHILGMDRMKGGNLIRKLARKMADNVIEQGLAHVTEVWGVEVSLYFPYAYAGRSDLIGEYKGVPSIMDFKNSKKIKKREWVEDYFLQGVAYSLCHNELFDTNIRQVVIFMASRDLDYKTFILEGDEFDQHCEMWIERLEQFYAARDE